MKTRSILAATLVAGALLAPAAPAFAGSNDTRVVSTCNIAQPCRAGAAGTVSLARSGAVLRVTGVRANAGWQVTIVRARGLNPQVEFRKGTTKVTFEAEVEDGVVKTKVRTRTV